MKNTFVYVFDSESKDKLIAEGYKLLKSDEKKNIYIFKNKDSQVFDLTGIDFVYSDVLTF